MKQDIYQEITNSIIESLEHVSVEDYKAPFAMLTSQKAPVNPITGHGYRGINTLVLWLQQKKQGYQSNEWGTFKQWKEKGAKIKKGEKSTTIIFYKQVIKKDAVNDVVTEKEETGFYHMVKSYRVFNADQVDGYEPATGLEEGILGTVEKLQGVEGFVASSGAIVSENGMEAFYCLLSDEIHMPARTMFFDNGQTATENYYATLLHELTHWTGADKRLGRELNGYNTHKGSYAFEELVAELGSAFLCAQFGIKQHSRDDHAAYIKSWLQALKNDKKYIFKAASYAQKAVDYLNERAGA